MVRQFIWWLQSRCTQCGNSVSYDAVESMEGICGWNKHCPRCRVTWFKMPYRAIAITAGDRDG